MRLRSRGSGGPRRRGTCVRCLRLRAVGGSNQSVDHHRPRKHGDDECRHGHKTEKGELTSRHETSDTSPRRSPSAHLLHLVDHRRVAKKLSTKSKEPRTLFGTSALSAFCALYPLGLVRISISLLARSWPAGASVITHSLSILELSSLLQDLNAESRTTTLPRSVDKAGAGGYRDTSSHSRSLQTASSSAAFGSTSGTRQKTIAICWNSIERSSSGASNSQILEIPGLKSGLRLRRRLTAGSRRPPHPNQEPT